MGQPVAVVAKPSHRRGLLRFEANRSLTGMGHERFQSIDDAIGNSPPAVLARRLLESGQVDAVHVYQNMITVDLKKGCSGDGLEKIVEDLYIYYRPGFVPPPLVMPEEPAAPSGDGAAPAAEEGGAAVDSRVPAHLLERSRAAKERWFAKQAG
jgi:hypothetical protein